MKNGSAFSPDLWAAKLKVAVDLLGEVAKEDCIELLSWPDWALGDEPKEWHTVGCGECVTCKARAYFDRTDK